VRTAIVPAASGRRAARWDRRQVSAFAVGHDLAVVKRPRTSVVTVRRVDLEVDDGVVAAAARLLSPSELVRAGSGTPGVRRDRILLRAALRRLLAAELGLHPGDVPLADRPGRPALSAAAELPQLDVNASASGAVGLVALVRGGRIGVDVERMGDEDLREALAERWLSPTEHTRIAALPEVDQPRALTRAWVQKEAVLKGEGLGLRGDLAATVTPVADRGRVGTWHLVPVVVPAGYVASLALRPRSWTARLAARRLPPLPAEPLPLSSL
jgi:4'-phosphopantetheinyl transferase